MSSPADTSYEEAIKWSRKVEPASKEPKYIESPIFWIGLFLVLAILIYIYIKYFRQKSNTEQNTALESINPNSKPQPILLDSRGRLYV